MDTQNLKPEDYKDRHLSENDIFKGQLSRKPNYGGSLFIETGITEFKGNKIMNFSAVHNEYILFAGIDNYEHWEDQYD
uniref:Restriction endonuclease subunit S n=1 Tax=Strongyloides venezuelensis TaxID=75913 RepID=A0A0K0F2U9_STRVS